MAVLEASASFPLGSTLHEESSRTDERRTSHNKLLTEHISFFAVIVHTHAHTPIARMSTCAFFYHATSSVTLVHACQKGQALTQDNIP